MSNLSKALAYYQAILALPAWWITIILKNLEGIDPSFEPVKFNPFKK